ncbi:CoA transferase [Candidatus Poriferisodalis sp.]|uniref:CaiB/BaiF CoA-transferase family protein n=1 Tax=Candidatus Poriferisodalis sp. TaxID=3101277 RepID=UPI003B51F6E2
MSSTDAPVDQATTPLAGVTVLDLTDHRGEFGPWMLSELGADVIKIEPPGGTPARAAMPLRIPDGAAFEVVSPDLRSWQFCAYNSNKRSVVLDLEDPGDRQVFERLVSRADFVYESGVPGTLAEAGYRHDDLRSLNARIIHVQVTPFGLDGPRSADPASEVSLAALGGSANMQGVFERAPVKASIAQAWRHAGAEAAAAGLMAHARMRVDGAAQHVAVSAQATMTWTLLNAMETHAICGRDFQRSGTMVNLAAPLQMRYRTQDGWAIGVARGVATGRLLDWYIEEGLADESWRAEDWDTYDLRASKGEPVSRTFEELYEALVGLCGQHTNADLLQRSVELGETIAPVHTVADLVEFEHLRVRDFWRPVELGGISELEGTSEFAGTPGVELPGGPATIDGVRIGMRRRPPLLDEHGAEIRAEAARAGEPGEPDGVAGSDRAVEPDGVPEPDWVVEPPESAGKPTAWSVGNAELPFARLRVADFSWIGVGPITAKSLADHGATVVRIESAGRIDGLRANPPFKDDVIDVDMAHFFGTFNTSKLSIDIDLKTPGGVDIARRMIAWADVVVESWTPGTFARNIADDELIAELNPNAIVVHTSLLASGGPLSKMGGFGYHAAAIAGFYPVVGWPDLPPDGPYLAYTDTISPRIITATLLAALDRRRRTGKGCVIEAAQLECGLQFLAPELADYADSGTVASRNGNRNPDVAPQGVYPCKGDDRWCAITIADDAQWKTLVELMGAPQWAQAPELSSLEGRLAAHDAIDDEISAWTVTQEAVKLERLLAGAGIAAGMAQRSSDLLADPQYAHRGFHRWLEHPRMGTVPYSGHQYQIAGYDHGPRFAAPMLGQHTFDVLSEQLGLTDEQIAGIAAAGALG